MFFYRDSNQTLSDEKIALLFQAIEPPLLDGIRKPAKLGGYSDSGADIAYSLHQRGLQIACPKAQPDSGESFDWVFPDTAEGLAAAQQAGATILWANTVLFTGHPLETVMNHSWIVGQLPKRVQRFDDKWVTKNVLIEAGCPVPASINIGVADVDSLNSVFLAENHLQFPLVVKPIRGRGSQGVSVVHDMAALQQSLADLFSASTPYGTLYGTRCIVEQFLPGQEITITIMPPGNYETQGKTKFYATHWALPTVERFNHQEGIAPYNGVVAVTHNSRVISDAQDASEALQRLKMHCIQAAARVDALAPIRIDCRQTEAGEFLLFDLNMKPNMTGAGRPGREEQDSLTCMAARHLGWRYGDLLFNMLNQAWRL